MLGATVETKKRNSMTPLKMIKNIRSGNAAAHCWHSLFEAGSPRRFVKRESPHSNRWRNLGPAKAALHGVFPIKKALKFRATKGQESKTMAMVVIIKG